MRDDPVRTSKRVLEPSERLAEVLFGLIMVLTFTGSLSIAEAGRDDIRAMLVGALGCNLAWGIIDGVFYLMGSLAEKGRTLATFVAIREASDPGRAHALIAGALPHVIAETIRPAELEHVRQRLRELPAPPARARLTASDWRGAAAVFLLVFLSTLPVAVPFIFMQNAMSAMRVSNAIAVVMLFGAGAAYGRTVGRSSWLLGTSMVGLGGALVALTVALGG
jgi:VIT1/CCC1 family predicted Fe2+/Mn2+ transporter